VYVALWNRNEDKTQQKIIDIQKDIAENQDKSEKLQNDLKQMDVDARKLLDEHKQAMVFILLLLLLPFSDLLMTAVFFFFQVTTQLQYIEDSEPVVGRSRDR